jgi:hypothetical protein
MNSGLEIGLPLDKQLKALWAKLELIGPAVRDLPNEMSGVIQCVGHFKSHLDPFVLASGHYATAAAYQLSIDCDFYFDDDFGDEAAGKPYWTW